MTRFAALVAVLLAVAACGARPAGSAAGSASPTSSRSTAAVTAPSAHAMCPDHVVEGQGAQVDLDGDGTADDVSFTPAAGSGCPGGLRATIGSVHVQAKTGSLQPASMRAVSIPGRKGQLLVVRETHPRGGFQDHLFAYADGTLAELTVDGHALLPFVTTDTVGDPSGGFTASCIQNGVAVLRAVAHQPVGIAPAFDIVATDYTIDGTTATVSGTRKVEDNVLDQQLGSAYPGLVKHAVLTEGCA